MMGKIYDYILEIGRGGVLYYQFLNEEAEYAVYFNPNEYKEKVKVFPFLVLNAYGFGFMQDAKAGVDIPQRDSRIIQTIERIICDFFNDKPDAVLLYHCDYTDGRQHKRSKLFERWYQRSQVKNKFRKIEVDMELPLESGYQTHYIGYLCLETNICKDAIQVEFEQFSLCFPFSKDPEKRV